MKLDTITPILKNPEGVVSKQILTAYMISNKIPTISNAPQKNTETALALITN